MTTIKETRKRLNKLPYTTVADLVLSGSQMWVGTLTEKEGDAIVIHNDEMIEPIYFNANEARMLVAALNVAIEENEKLLPCR